MPRWRRVPVLAAASGIAAALLVGLVVLLIGSESEDTAYAWSSMKGRGAAADAKGYARLTSVDAGTRVSLQARRLPGERGDQFELWCVRTDGRWVSGGTFKSRADGRAAAELTAAVTPGDYHLIVDHHDGRRARARGGRDARQAQLLIEPHLARVRTTRHDADANHTPSRSAGAVRLRGGGLRRR